MQAVNIPDMPASIALVDFSSLLSVHFHARAKDGGVNDAGQATLDQIASVRDSVERVVVCLDWPPYWRKQRFEGYKELRDRDPAKGHIIRWTLDRLEADGYQLARCRGQESDDVIATLARVYSEAGCDDIRIVGEDKDLLQCVSETVRLMVPTGDGYEPRGPEYVSKKYDVRPDQFALAQAINGDDSDSIPGIKNLGWKSAAWLINTYGTPQAMIEACTAACSAAAEAGKEPNAKWRYFAAGMAELNRWLELTTLRTDVELERDPMSYLEYRRTPESGTKTTAWEPEPEELAEEREQMTAPAAPLIGADPKADEHLRRAAQERSSASTSASATRTPTATTPRPTAGTSTAPSRPTEPTSSATPTRAPAPTPAAASRPSAATPPASAPTAGTRTRRPEGLALLREPFPDHLVSKLPKGTKAQNMCPPNEKRNCTICGGWHHPRIVHLDYVGHAATTDRLLDADPGWTWEPAALSSEGLPLFDASGGLWIRLTVCGVTRLGYGHAEKKAYQDVGAREKEVIGDALRNAAMRFGLALDLWHKGDLHKDEGEEQ
ncbi:MAG TPA: 5'-3' exonuclease H3TH domain-containing protein [Thermomicrobiales bacterium]|nr:5'-3' exonuclease H3TH domain-containing protein [Thermomicrobiales bacterium]